jgi:rod shape-determining protein MreD
MLTLIRPTLFVMLLICMVLLQAFAAHYSPALKTVDLPLLTVLYITLTRERLTATVLLGSTLGIWQDSLSLSPLGLNGLVKISVGSLAYVANTFLAIDTLPTRWLVLFICSSLSALASWALRLMFLSRGEMLDEPLMLLSGLLNATIGLALFYMFDHILKPAE